LAGLQVAVEARTGIAGKHGVPGVESLDREQALRAAQALDVAQVHHPVPLHLPEGEDFPRPAGLTRREHRDVNLDLGPVSRVRDHAGPDLPRRPAEDRGIGRDRVVAADRFEMRSRDLGQETGAGSGPDGRSAAEFQTGPFPAHDGLVERDERLGYAVPRPTRSEQIRLPDQQPGILQHPERMRDIVGLPADIAGNSA
jgi:hypothetical protein